MEAKDGKPFQSAKGSSDLGCQIVRLYDCVLEQSLIFTSLVTVYIHTYMQTRRCFHRRCRLRRAPSIGVSEASSGSRRPPSASNV